MIGNGAKLTVLLMAVVCLGCSDNDSSRASRADIDYDLDYDLTGTWEAVNAQCMSDLPTEVLRHLEDPATWERQIEGDVRVVQTGDMLEIFDTEAEAPFSGTVTGDRLEYALSQDDLLIEGEGVIESADRLTVDHTFTFPEAGGSVSCQFDVIRL